MIKSGEKYYKKEHLVSIEQPASGIARDNEFTSKKKIVHKKQEKIFYYRQKLF